MNKLKIPRELDFKPRKDTSRFYEKEGEMRAMWNQKRLCQDCGERAVKYESIVNTVLEYAVCGECFLKRCAKK